MKLLLIIYDVDFEEDVMDLLEAEQVGGYTQWDRVLGKGERSDPKLDTPVWPGFNRALAVALEDAAEEKLLQSLEGLSRRLGGSGFKVLELPLLRVL